LSSADDIGLTIALSCERLPAPTTIDPSGSSYSPTRRSWIRL
jgi:hypothetical protein